MIQLEGLEKKIGIRFKNQDLLKESLTHRSYLNERSSWPHPHNERLEYLGDAVLELAVSEGLFARFPNFPEGQLTVLRAALVNYQMLSRVATDIGLEKFILMSKGEARDKGKAREVILANTIESLIGALYLDQGFEKTKEFVHTWVLTHLDSILKSKSYKDPKSELQEIIQERMKLTPTYRVLEENGPAHQRIFKVGVYLGEKFVSEGRGSSKQEAETEAAREALLSYKSGK